MPPFAGSVDKDEDVPMAGNPPSESLADIEEAVPLYPEYITTDAFCAVAEGVFQDPSLESIVPRYLIRSCFEAESDAAKMEILEAITEYFQDPATGKRRETFIVSPFDDNINFLVRYGAHSHGRSLTIIGPSNLIRDVPAWLVHLIDRVFDIMRLRIPYFEPKGFRWFLHQQDLGLTLLSYLRRFVHFGTDPSYAQFLLMFPHIEGVRSDCFWEFAGKESRSQLCGDALGLVDCSESMMEDQFADDEGEGSQLQPRSRARSRSPPSLRRSSRLKRRRINYSEVSDTDGSHDDKDDLDSDGEQESDLSSGRQSETVEFSSPEDSVPGAYCKAPVKTRTTPLVPAFTEADLIFPLTQPDELKLAVLFAASNQVAQLQTLVYYSCEEASYCLATAAIDWVSVSIVAEGLAPSDHKGQYAPEACSQLYESGENAEFRRKALLGPNWERLRGASSFEGAQQPQEGDPFGLNDVDSGTCGRCLAFIHRLAEHEPSCVGRCCACVQLHVPCVRPVGKKTCVTCPTKQKCRKPSHKEEALPKGPEQCYMCLQFVGNIYSHVRECRGRCQNCIAKKVPCTRGNFAGNHKCKNCHAQYQDCGKFSHDKRGTCKKCKAPVHDMRTHRPYCQGQCGMGDDLDRECDGSWRRPKHRGGKTEDEADVEDDEGTEEDEDSES
ncbi:hypothetical protein BFJ68_g1038 [Fusarium oxysporum]|uniref:Uncharacterized protein n=1 Tax=Fusarium oxysporum TaxID=5507 RepID=A0A420S3V5_FUSOX|nr:hypothetical protein BFJ68_g1038 [Fusarium oxysporum]